MRQSYTGVLERNVTFHGEFCTEPMEAAWATEARWFVQVLPSTGAGQVEVIAQVSPDGLTWCDLDSDSAHEHAGEGLLSWAVRDFGGWLRLRGHTDTTGAKVRIYLALKE